MIIIKLTDVPSQTFQVVLGNQNCTISLYQREKRMYMDLIANDVPICAGAICVNGTEIVQYATPSFDGTLHFYDIRGQEAPQWTALVDRFAFLYVSVDEEIPEELRF